MGWGGSNHPSCVTKGWILAPRRATGLSPTSTCHARPAETSKNWTIKTGRRWWWEDGVFRINLHPLCQHLLASRSSTGLCWGWVRSGISRRVLATASTAGQSHRWQDASGNTDVCMLSPSQLPSSQHREFLGCQRGRCKYPALPEAHLCLMLALSGDCTAQGVGQ